MEPSIIVRLSETTLKGRNRNQFEKRVAQNIRSHLAPHGEYHFQRDMARITINGGGDLDLAMAVLKGIPGIANLSLANPVASDMASLEKAVVDFMATRLEGQSTTAGGSAKGGHEIHRSARGSYEPDRPVTFRLLVSRKDKGYPVPSMEVAKTLGGAVLKAFPELKVDLEHADVVVHVELFREYALLFQEKVAGPGGLAVGSSGKGICLLSGGIDSPVAAYQMMTRGLKIVHLNFHSFPFIGEQSKEKVHDIVRFLARYQPYSRLYVAPFANIQVAIRDNCPEGLRTVLYRRMMNRVANHVASTEKAGAIITGESLGQVASQTLKNIRAIEETAELPVLQPLIGLPKNDIIDRARKIGTYNISLQPFPDCCTLFQPKSPETGAKPGEASRAEARLPIEELVAECLDGLEVTNYGAEYYPARWGD